MLAGRTPDAKCLAALLLYQELLKAGDLPARATHTTSWSRQAIGDNELEGPSDDILGAKEVVFSAKEMLQHQNVVMTPGKADEYAQTAVAAHPKKLKPLKKLKKGVSFESLNLPLSSEVENGDVFVVTNVNSGSPESPDAMRKKGRLTRRLSKRNVDA